MSVTDSQRIVLEILKKNKPNTMNNFDIAKISGKNPGAIASTLKSLASRDFVYQLDRQGKTTITPDGEEELY